jgi:hypothetical protein
VIYSRWRPDGGYDYYQSAERRGLGDDLPIPHLASIGGIGVPSTDAGRHMPSGTRYVGSGPVARGSIAPLDRRGLSLGAVSPTVSNVGLLLVAALFGWWLRGQLAKECG